MTTQDISDAATTESRAKITSPNTTKKKLVLIDGHAMIHRAFHAVPEGLTNTKGEPVNATFGFTSMLMKALLEEKPEYIAMTFDRPSPTFRHEQFAAYKAQRPALPDTMRPQFKRIREMVQAFGIPIYEKDGFEADDVLGTLSVQATEHGVDTIIYTGDMDTLQLVNEHVMVKVAKRGITEITAYDDEAVKARYGLPPQKLPDFKGLVGDKSDNIPGVAGIGEKTASKLIADYGDLEGVLAHIDELKPKEQKLLREASDQARKSKFLATIILDAPVQLDLEACRIEKLNRDTVLAIFRELEFRTMVEKVLALFRDLGLGSPADTEAMNSEGKLDGGADTEISQSDSLGHGRPQGSPLQEEEDLLLAPPVGVVPIMSPPLPPRDGEADDESGAKELLVSSAAGSQAEPLEQVPLDASTVDGPAQLSLFETPEMYTEVVRKLRLPSIPTTPIFMDEESSS